MSTLLKAHDKDLGGGFIVRRLLPAAAKQAVGPFIFFDHFGPITAPAEANHDVRPHPHIGLATVTYLYEGAIEHRDSLGTVQRIEPGAINWMSAGRGIVHSERTPQDLLGQERRSHGLQLWCALPKEHEDSAPSFAHTPAGAIPQVDFDSASVRVLIGSAFGVTSPVQTHAPTYYLDIELGAGGMLSLDQLPEEAALYLVEGDLAVDGLEQPEHTLQLLNTANLCTLSSLGGVRCVVIGGAALDGPRYLYWNFVASDKARLVQAAEDWEAQRFDKVPGETEWIPLPPNARPKA